MKCYNGCTCYPPVDGNVGGYGWDGCACELLHILYDKRDVRRCSHGLPPSPFQCLSDLLEAHSTLRFNLGLRMLKWNGNDIFMCQH